LPDFKSSDELNHGITLSMKNGEAGVSLFRHPSDEVLEILKGSGVDEKI
jgi:hypothetical protein